MSPGLLLVGIVVAGYLAAHVASEWLARRHLIVSGAEYLLLGALLGPEVLGLLQASPVDGFAPFLTLAFGWVGALVGVQFRFAELRRLPLAPFALSLAEALLAGTAVAVAMGALLVGGLGFGTAEALGPSIALGAIGVCSAPAGIAVVVRRAGLRGPVVRLLHVATAVDALVAIVAFGLLTGLQGAGLGLLVGVVGGLLFHLFLGGERDVDRLFIALAGALILTSGAAAYLRVSPLLPSFLVGLVLVNTSPARDRIRTVLTRVERPLYFVLLVFAGAAWRPGAEGWWVVALAFLAVRAGAKVGGARLATRMLGAGSRVGHHWGWGLVGHGGLAVALALSLRMADASTPAGHAFTAALVSVLITDALSARVVEAVLSSHRRSRGAAAPGAAGGPR